MFNSILVALEGGDASRQALCMAVDMARAAHAKITALFVVEHHLAIGDVILGVGHDRDMPVEDPARTVSDVAATPRAIASHSSHLVEPP